MYDHSYNPNSMTSLLQRGDFINVPLLLRDAFRLATLNAATISALNNFNNKNPIQSFHLKQKKAYAINNLIDEIVVRKLTLNLKKIIKYKPSGRTYLVNNLINLLAEGTPYRIYRLDIKSFYESISPQVVLNKVLPLQKLSPLSKNHLGSLLKHYQAMDGEGLPRGMAISAVLSDYVMSDFDLLIKSNPSVYFYGRYVDDIIIITNLSEIESDFILEVKESLNSIGLKLNENKNKKSINSIPFKSKAVKVEDSVSAHLCEFTYLGYSFSISNPLQKTIEADLLFRKVRVEIAAHKVNKIKTRIVRAFMDFHHTKNSLLLLQRVKFLTSNFSIFDKNTGKRKLAGIYYSYPLISKDSESLISLDKFLRHAVLSKTGKIFSKTAPLLDTELKQILLKQSFVHGHLNKTFVYFNPYQIGEIQECWKYE